MRRIGYRKDLFKSSMRKYRKSSIKPPRGGLFISRWDRFSIKTYIKNGKAKVQEAGDHAAEGQEQLAELPIGK